MGYINSFLLLAPIQNRVVVSHASTELNSLGGCPWSSAPTPCFQCEKQNDGMVLVPYASGAQTTSSVHCRARPHSARRFHHLYVPGLPFVLSTTISASSSQSPLRRRDLGLHVLLGQESLSLASEDNHSCGGQLPRVDDAEDARATSRGGHVNHGGFWRSLLLTSRRGLLLFHGVVGSSDLE